MSYLLVNPVINYSVRTLCRKPYPNHPKGCPNWNEKKGCPPNIPLFDRVIDTEKPIFAIYNKFNFAAHVRRMKEKHPEWSQRQCECCLYWQGTARKQLKQHIKDFLKEYPGYKVITTPEAMGVNITETMKKLGIKLEWPPKQWAYQVVLAGVEKK